MKIHEPSARPLSARSRWTPARQRSTNPLICNLVRGKGFAIGVEGKPLEATTDEPN